MHAGMEPFTQTSPVTTPRSSNELDYDEKYIPRRDSGKGSLERESGKESLEMSVLSDDSHLPSHALLQKDVEAQREAPAEYTVSTGRKMMFLTVYFLLNLGLTLSNKGVMQKARFPWLLTVMHTTSTSFGCAALLGMGHFKLSKLGTRENLVLVAFSVLFTLNIAISNVSLALVSVPFHQVLRSTCPIVTIVIYRIVYSREYSRQTWLTMIPLIFGVGLATFGDYDFTLLGFALTFLGVILASVKTIASNRLMTGTLKLSALEILFRMSPLAAVQCLLYAAASGELTAVRESVAEGTFDWSFIAALMANAAMAFCLNIVSFQTNKVAGALTVSVCGNLKQILTILLGIVLFSVTVTPLNGVGMLITVVGAAWYSKVEFDTKRIKAAEAAAAS